MNPLQYCLCLTGATTMPHCAIFFTLNRQSNIFIPSFTPQFLFFKVGFFKLTFTTQGPYRYTSSSLKTFFLQVGYNHLGAIQKYLRFFKNNIFIKLVLPAPLVFLKFSLRFRVSSKSQELEVFPDGRVILLKPAPKTLKMSTH